MPQPKRSRAAGAGLLIVLTLGIFKVAPAADTHAAEPAIRRALEAVRVDPEASRRHAERALDVLARLPNVELEIRARLILCDYFSERDRAQAEEQLARALALLDQAERVGLRSGVLACRGTISETAGHNATALQLYEEAIEAATAADDREMLANALYARGYLLGLQGQYAAGLADLKRAQSIFEEIDLPYHALTALNGVAILYNRMGEFAQARDMYRRALKEQRAAGLRRELVVTLHNLGRAYENLGDWTQAQAAFHEAAEISRQLGYARGEAYALRGLAAVANARNDAQRALDILARAERRQRETPDARLHAQILLARGVALHKVGQLVESAAVLEEAARVFEAADSLHELRKAYAALSAVYADMGAWKKAYLYLNHAKETSERLWQNQIDQRFASLKVEFDTVAKEKENALLVRANEVSQHALAAERRARALQGVVIVLTAVLAILLAGFAIGQWRTTHRMRHLALTDELTGVPNRRAVLSRLERLLKDGRTACALLIVDIDHFKQINDRFGHPEGDQALQLVARCLRDQVCDPAFFGRLGGEEFAVVLPSAQVGEARALAERIRERIMVLDGLRWLEDRPMTVSIGLTISTPGDTPSTMLQRADAALYEAKRAGRNCVRIQPLPEKPSHVLQIDAASDAQQHA